MTYEELLFEFLHGESTPRFRLDMPLTGKFASMSLVETRAWLWERLQAGGFHTCPCCARLMRIYRRSLYATAGRLLVLFYRATIEEDSEWVSYKTVTKMGHKGGGEQILLRHWDLLEQHPSERGVWRVTTKGKAFMRGEISMPKWVYVCVGEILFFDGPEVSMSAVMRENFDYGDIFIGEVEL